MATAKLCDDGWIRCAQCRHKLGKAVGRWSGERSLPAIEIKCHSCKSINYIMVGGNDSEGNAGRRGIYPKKSS